MPQTSTAGLEHQHTHRAPHAHPTAHTLEALAAINAPDFQAADENGAQGVAVTTATATTVASEEEEGEEKLHTLMGLSLLLGFIFMLFVDQIGGGHSHAPPSGM